MSDIFVVKQGSLRIYSEILFFNVASVFSIQPQKQQIEMDVWQTLWNEDQFFIYPFITFIHSNE